MAERQIEDGPSTLSEKFEFAFTAVKSLSEAFQKDNSHYINSGTYQEAEVRTDFIDKLFNALGWDVNHDRQRDPYRQEVKIEKTVPSRSSGKADYAFSLTPFYKRVRFLVEAKRPQPNIVSPDNCFQIIRYAWPQRAPISILTDFNNLHVVDTRFRPNINSATSRVVKSWHCSQLQDRDKFSELYWLLSREAVAEGSIDRFAAEVLPIEQVAARQYNLFPGDTRDFDDDFLEQLDDWREQLAVAFTQEPNSNGHVDLTIVADHCTPIRVKLGEAKIYSSPSYHIKGIGQLLGRYTTGRETPGLLINYVRKPDIKSIVGKLKTEMDKKLPEHQTGPCQDHLLKWSLLTRHKHSSGEIVSVGHIGFNLHV